MTEAPQILLNHRLKSLRLPTVLREYGKLMQAEDENSRLKKYVADLALDREMLQHVIRRKL